MDNEVVKRALRFRRSVAKRRPARDVPLARPLVPLVHSKETSTHKGGCMDQLTQMKCVACRKGEPTLTDAEIDGFRPQVPTWNIIEVDGVNRLERPFNFDNFVHALAFTNKVGELAEQEGHHPALLTERRKRHVT